MLTHTRMVPIASRRWFRSFFSVCVSLFIPLYPCTAVTINARCIIMLCSPSFHPWRHPHGLCSVSGKESSCKTRVGHTLQSFVDPGSCRIRDHPSDCTPHSFLFIRGALTVVYWCQPNICQCISQRVYVVISVYHTGACIFDVLIPPPP